MTVAEVANNGAINRKLGGYKTTDVSRINRRAVLVVNGGSYGNPRN